MDKSALYISIICIIATEFWERFSFCGLRTILSLYLRNELKLMENSATIVYHIFIMICYIIPVVGAICADSFLGRYRTIFYFSLIYIVGNIFMIFAAIPTIDLPPILATVIGLGCVAIGTGGTKPCVAAFGGDQFYLPAQQDKLQQFFSLFYFAINLGGFVGMILTPILRKAVTCFGDDTCYALGFGFPAFLMVLSILLFVLGKPWYRMKKPKSNVMLEFVNCTTYALTQKIKSKNKRGEKKLHWLDYAYPKFNDKLIYDMKIVYAVLCLYTPLPLFWSLFDQQGSRWTFQASRMNGFFLGVQIVPDQMQVINPAMVLVLIPFFDKYLYPLMTRKNILTNHLHRMAVGGLIAGLAFFSAGVLELFLEKDYPRLPGKHEASVNIINSLPCNVGIYNPFNKFIELDAKGKYSFEDIPAVNSTEYNVTVRVPMKCGGFKLPGDDFLMTILAVEGQVDTILIGADENYEVVDYIIDPIEFKRSLSGKPRLRIVFLRRSEALQNISINFRSNLLNDIYFMGDFGRIGLVVSDYLELPADGYEYTVQANEVKNMHNAFIHLALGGVYTLVLSERDKIIEFAKIYTMSPPNVVNIIWLIPQYFLISIAEIMFGIAGLEFSFTQAPKSMKTVTIAAWYLSVAIGNFLVIIITQANIFSSQAHEFFLFAVLIVGDMMIFIEIASSYHYVELEADSSVLIMPRPLMSVYDATTENTNERTPLKRTAS